MSGIRFFSRGTSEQAGESSALTVWGSEDPSQTLLLTHSLIQSEPLGNLSAVTTLQDPPKPENHEGSGPVFDPSWGQEGQR